MCGWDCGYILPRVIERVILAADFERRASEEDGRKERVEYI